MGSPNSGRDPIEQLAEEFAERFRRGERPSLTEYTDRYPDLAGDIRELFPALLEMEQLSSVGDQCTGPQMRAAPGSPALEQLGEYRLLREIGRGGMGVVYEAVQESLGRHVALKVLPYHGLLSPIQLERFRREARAAARLHHTNIVPVFGVGEEAGTHFYAMQFIQGQGLDVVLDEVRRLHGSQEAMTRDGWRPGPTPSERAAAGLLSGQFERLRAIAADIVGRNADPSPSVGRVANPSEQLDGLATCPTKAPESPSTLASLTETQYYRSVAQVAIQVAEALEYAHGQGILHRDIKPSNLLLDTHGTVWVADFGLAKAEDSDDLTNTGDLVGTLRFMAPERFEGRCDVRSEVYSLGLTLYEMLTLRPAFAERDRLALIDRVRHEEPPRPCQCDPKIPRDLETIVLKAMAKDPADRYATAAELAEDLRRFLADRPIRARRTPWRERAWRWCRRNPAVASLTALALLLLVTVAVVSTVAAVWLKGERDRVARARDNEALARGAAEKAERERRLELVQALQDRAHAGRMSRRQGQRFASLDALSQAAQLARELDLPPERLAQLRNEAIACLALPDMRLAKKLDVWPLGTHAVCFDDDYQRYARVDREGRVTVRRVADDMELYHWSAFNGGETGLAWSRDGRYLVTGNAGTLKAWHFPRHEVVAALPPLANVQGQSFSPDSRQLAVVTRDGMLTLYDLSSGGQVKRLALGGGGWGCCFHPTRRWLALAQGNTIRTYDLDAEKPFGKDLLHPAGVGAVVWHPDGNSLAAACSNLKIYVWDLATRRPTAVLEGCRNSVVHLTFNRAGDLLISDGWDGLLRFWHPRTGKQVFSTPGDLVLASSFSPDDRQIAARITGPSGQLEPGLWDVAACREYRTLVHDPIPPGDDRPPSYYGGSLHPNGRWLALAMWDGVRIWDLPSRRQLAWLPIGQTGGVRFEPSGALLTNGDSGWWRWPLHTDAANGSRLRIGPPDRFPVPGMFMNISGSHDGRVLAVPFLNGGVVLHADRPYQPIRLVPQDDVRGVSVSPDGRWVATGRHNGTGIKVWEAATGKLVKELLLDHTHCGPNFSRDGRWLATSASGDGCRLWAVGSWEPGIHLPNSWGAMFTTDGWVLATSVALGVLALIDPATGREYVRLEDPNQDDFDWFEFTPDGTQLITSSFLGLVIHVWDLRLIRQQLAELGLDWDGPPRRPIRRFPQPPEPPQAPPKAEVEGLDLVANPEKWRQYQHARAMLTLALNPFDAEAHFLLARELLDAGNMAEAYRHLTFALTFRPGFGAAYIQRAQAAFRLKRWADAVADASVVLRDQPYDADTLSIRGQAYQQLGRHAEAVADFTRALDRYPHSSRLFELRAVSYAGLGKQAEAQADRDQALKESPRRALSLNNQAWQLVSGAVDQRDPARALQLSTEAVRLEPGNPVYLNTLGVVQYRLGRYADAAATLEKSLAAGQGTHDAFDLFFLAMCYHHLGDAARARLCYDRAVQWFQNKKDLDFQSVTELEAFQAEAAALLKPPRDRVVPAP